jgi:hypothetical protein
VTETDSEHLRDLRRDLVEMPRRPGEMPEPGSLAARGWMPALSSTTMASTPPARFVRRRGRRSRSSCGSRGHGPPRTRADSCWEGTGSRPMLARA